MNLKNILCDIEIYLFSDSKKKSDEAKYLCIIGVNKRPLMWGRF